MSVCQHSSKHVCGRCQLLCFTPVDLMDFLKMLIGIGDIRYGFVHFEQGSFCIMGYGPHFSNDMLITDHV